MVKPKTSSVAKPEARGIRVAKPTKKVAAKAPPSLTDAKKHPPVNKAPFPHLFPTATPGVFTNSSGNLVDANGVLLNIGKAKETEDQAAMRILGEKADSPAKVLRRVALDPTLPLAMRMEAAKHAAPYYDKKTPIAVENTNTDRRLDLEAIAGMPADKRRELLAQLKTLGVDLGGPKVPTP